MTERWTVKLMRRVVAFVIAVCVMVVLGSATHSYFVQQAWSFAAGHAEATGPVAIPFADRISWAAHDLGGMILPYAGVTSIGLLIAFLVAGALARFSGYRLLVFAAAGAAAILVIFITLRVSLGTVGIFGARGPMGLAGQALVGLLAGVLFARLTARRES